MISPALSRLVERNFAANQVVAQATRTAPMSACCRAGLTGDGPILWCSDCGHTIPAADLDHEYHPHPKAVT